MEFSRKQNIHIMPRAFGPAGGPRQAPNHDDFRHIPTKFTRYVVGFLGRANQVCALLPKGLALRGEPIVQFQFFSLTEIPWLAGRGYNILSMTVPVRYLSAGGESVDGQYQPVLWENLGDPIITGREQLGHPKLYAQLPAPRHWNGKTYIRARWEDFTFAELEMSCEAVPTQELLSNIAASVGAGLIGHKYIPKTGHWDEADADYFTLTPMPGESNLRDPQPLPAIRSGTGRVKFNVPEWQDMPTQYHIIQQLAALEQCAPIDAVIMEGATYADAFDQRILD
jgi:hypothetical protein